MTNLDFERDHTNYQINLDDNGLARWTSNQKVVGSNPSVGVLLKIDMREISLDL